MKGKNAMAGFWEMPTLADRDAMVGLRVLRDLNRRTASAGRRGRFGTVAASRIWWESSAGACGQGMQERPYIGASSSIITMLFRHNMVFDISICYE